MRPPIEYGPYGAVANVHDEGTAAIAAAVSSGASPVEVLRVVVAYQDRWAQSIADHLGRVGESRAVGMVRGALEALEQDPGWIEPGAEEWRRLVTHFVEVNALIPKYPDALRRAYCLTGCINRRPLEGGEE